MATNLDRFKTDLASLIERGDQLLRAMAYACDKSGFEAAMKKVHGDKAAAKLKALPDFKGEYQAWYSEAIALLRQVLPERLDDFVRHYQKPKGRKDIGYENYRIEDYLQDLHVTRGYQKETVVGRSAAIPQFQQQLAIVRAAEGRFSSSLFEIRQLVQADLLDSEMDAAEVLATHKFLRAAGAVAGVVIEKHLAQACSDHSLKIAKKHPTIADLNETLKSGGVIDLPQWRFIQHLTDIRNLCDHGRAEPTSEQVSDLLQGTKKIIKTVL